MIKAKNFPDDPQLEELCGFANGLSPRPATSSLYHGDLDRWDFKLAGVLETFRSEPRATRRLDHHVRTSQMEGIVAEQDPPASARDPSLQNSDLGPVRARIESHPSANFSFLNTTAIRNNVSPNRPNNPAHVRSPYGGMQSITSHKQHCSVAQTIPQTIPPNNVFRYSGYPSHSSPSRRDVGIPNDSLTPTVRHQQKVVEEPYGIATNEDRVLVTEPEIAHSHNAVDLSELTDVATSPISGLDPDDSLSSVGSSPANSAATSPIGSRDPDGSLGSAGSSSANSATTSPIESRDSDGSLGSVGSSPVNSATTSPVSIPEAHDSIGLEDLHGLPSVSLSEEVWVDFNDLPKEKKSELKRMAQWFRDWDTAFHDALRVWEVIKNGRSFPLNAFISRLDFCFVDFVLAVLANCARASGIDLINLLM
jgi:hypothetical protein